MSFNFESLFGAKLQTKEGEVNTNEALSDKEAVAIYFSAHWCPPCRGFTPVASEKYNQLIAAGKKFEVVFASSDKDDESFTDYYKSMPWLGLPFAEREIKEKLAKEFKCNGIPYLVVLDGETGEVITTNGRGGISGENFIEEFPWHAKAMYDISESMDGIEENVSLMLIQDGCDQGVKDKNSEVLLNFAKSNDKSSVKKFFTGNGGGPLGFIKGEFHLPALTPKHRHDLVKCTPENPGPIDGAYAGGWCCDVCRAQYAPGHVNRNICSLAKTDCKDNCDYCDACAKKCEEPVPEEAKVPQMLIVNVADRKYYKPMEGKTNFCEDNLKQLVLDFAAGSLTEKKFKSAE